MSLQHATESCTSILNLSPAKAHDLSLFAKHQGFSCLGTWTREECLEFGEELLKKDLDCRVVPFNEGVAPRILPEIRVEGVPSSSVKTAPKKAFVEDTYLLSFTS